MKINYLDNNPREIQLEEDLPPAAFLCPPPPKWVAATATSPFQ